MYLTVLLAGFGDVERPVSALDKALSAFHANELPPGEGSYARFSYDYGAQPGEPLTNAPFELMKERLYRFVRDCASKLGVDLESPLKRRKGFHVHLVGYGTGAMIALYALAEHRPLLSACRRLVSLDAPHTGVGLGGWPAFMTPKNTAPRGMGWQLLQFDRGAFVERYLHSVRERVFAPQSALLGREDVLQLHPLRGALGGNPFDVPTDSVDADHEGLANHVASLSLIKEFLFGELSSTAQRAGGSSPVTSALAPRIDGWSVLTPRHAPVKPWEPVLPGLSVRMWGQLSKGDVAVFNGQPQPTRYVTDATRGLEAEFTLPQGEAPGPSAFLLRHMSANWEVHDSAAQALRLGRDTRCRLEPAWGYPGDEVSLIHEGGALDAGCRVLLRPPTGGPGAPSVTLPSRRVDGQLRFQVPAHSGLVLSVHCRFSHGERSQELPLTVAPFLHPFAEGTLVVPGEQLRLRGRFARTDILLVGGAPCAARFSEDDSGACWSVQAPELAPPFLFRFQVRHGGWVSNEVIIWAARYIANLSKTKRELHALGCKRVSRMTKQHRLPLTGEQASSLKAGGFDNCHYCLGGSTR